MMKPTFQDEIRKLTGKVLQYFKEMYTDEEIFMPSKCVEDESEDSTESLTSPPSKKAKITGCSSSDEGSVQNKAASDMFSNSQKHALHLIGASGEPELNSQYRTTEPEYSNSMQILLNDLGESQSLINY